MRSKLSRLLPEKGLLTTFVLSLSALFFFFSNILLNLNHTFMGASGDGLQAYFTAIYHSKFDASYWHFEGMNYPYGEQVFFTGCQPFVSNLIKLLQPLVDLSPYTVGIVNFILLGSIMLCAIFIYSIFKHLKVNWIIASIAATAIAFLSPQIERLGGHYSLCYQFFIPLLILLLLKFHEAPQLKKTLLIGGLTLLASATHFYFFGFFALILGFYHAGSFLKQRNRASFKFTLLHGFLQVLLPFIIVQLLSAWGNTASDRTSYPWGYLEFKSNLSGIFFHEHRFYSILLKPFFSKAQSWEGIAFVGLIGILCSLLIVSVFVSKLVRMRWRNSLHITDQPVLNTYFWASLAGLLIAFGFPFVISDWHRFLPEASYINQLRGIGRFAWIFYYGINILAVYHLHRFLQAKSKLWIYSLWVFVLGVMTYDAYIMSSNISPFLNNRITALEDKDNKNSENRWMNKIDFNEYQTLVQFPYFHVGSENIWINNESNMRNLAFVTSIKTGIPLMMVNLSRTSLSQTYANIELFSEPYRPNPLVLKQLKKNGKPMLILANEAEISPSEREFLMNCEKLDSNAVFSVYKLEIKALEARFANLYEKELKRFKEQTFTPCRGFEYSGSKQDFYFNDFDETEKRGDAKIHTQRLIPNNSNFSGAITQFNVLYDSRSLPSKTDTSYSLSFWVKNFKQDLIPRTTVEIIFFNQSDSIYKTQYFQLKDAWKVFEQNDALIEYEFTVKNPEDKIKITLWNDNFYGLSQHLQLDNLLIKPSTSVLYFHDSKKGFLYKNNRLYWRK